MRLTDLAVQQAPTPAAGQRTYFDDAVRGFGLRVSCGGSKSWIVMYGEKRRLKTLGRYPAKSLKTARREAMAFLSGEVPDPSRETVPDAISAFLEYCHMHTSPRTAADYRRLLDRHMPTGRLANLTRQQLLTRLGCLSATPGEQSHAFTAITVFLNWCVANGKVMGNPLSGVRGIGRIRSRERVLSTNELKTVLSKALADDYPFGAIVALCIATGQRRSEVANLRWEWIGEDTITLPAAVTKNRREHRFPIGTFTRAILGTIPHRDDSLFPGRGERAWNGWSKAKREFDPLASQWQLHDLRRTFASLHADLGTPIHVIEKLLNHVSGTFAGITGVYNRALYMGPMTDAVAVYEAHLSSLLAQA